MGHHQHVTLGELVFDFSDYHGGAAGHLHPGFATRGRVPGGLGHAVVVVFIVASFASPLKRTVATATPIAKAVGLNIQLL